MAERRAPESVRCCAMSSVPTTPARDDRPPMLATAMQLASSMEALAALAAHLRVEREGLAVPNEVRALLAAIAHEVAGPTSGAPVPMIESVVGMTRSLLRLSSDVAEHPEQIGRWVHTDDVILQGMGRMSMALVEAVSSTALVLPSLGELLSVPGVSILDVRTGA